MSEAEQNRSEQPTPFKLSRAREQGSVARGMDLGFLTALAALAVYVAVAGPDALGRVAQGARSVIVTAPHLAGSEAAVIALIGSAFGVVIRPLALLAALVFLCVLVMEIVQTGPVFTTQPLKPDFSRLSPAKGFKRVFSRRMLIETGKSVLKLSVYCALAGLVVSQIWRRELAALADAAQLAQAMRGAMVRLLGFFIAAAAFFAVIDQLIVRREFLANMRMSRREIRRESRDREGDPRMKQRRKRLHQDFIRASQSLRGVRDADVLITNPVHYAVGLRYDPSTMAAPMIVARGEQRFALRLRRLAFVHGIEIVESRALARALAACPLGQQIPDSLFRPVAEIYRRMRERPNAGAQPVA